MRVLAWDATGNHLVPHEVLLGEEIEWKRNGYRGTMRCAVVGMNEAANKIRIQPLDEPRARVRWVKAKVSCVYDHSGRRKTRLPD